MKKERKEEKREIVVLDKGIETDTSGDPVRAIMCCFGMLIAFRA